MGLKNRLKQHENLTASLLLTAAVFAVFVTGWDFYYDLNDDVLIKDILSGVYSGSPSGYTMQLLYPLGFVLSVLYRGLSVPVFGVFLILCQFGAVWAVGYQSAACCKTRAGKAIVLAAEGLLWTAAFGMHFVYVQYTVTAGMLAGAALFWILTAKRRRWIALLLYWLAFCLRTEMALLILPLACIAGLCALVREARNEKRDAAEQKDPLVKKNAAEQKNAPAKRKSGAAVRYVSLFGVLLAGMGILYAADAAAYSGTEWKQFRQFFDDRTALYDYRLDFAEQYEENKDAYEKLGISKARQQLLANYNFGADDGIDAGLMHQLAQAASGQEELAEQAVSVEQELSVGQAASGQEASGGQGLSVAVWRLLHENWFGKGDAPLNLIWIGMGLAVCVLSCKKGRLWKLWQPLFAGACGAFLWLYLLLQGRMVERVTHPLYLAQILLFAGLWLAERREEAMRESAADKSGCGRADRRAGGKVCAAAKGFLTPEHASALFAGACVAVGLVFLPGTISEIGAEAGRRETVNAANEAVMDYCMAHPKTLFLEDVYSTVAYSEKIMTDRDKPFNYDLLGGWLVKSPLTARKLSAFGFSSMGEAVCAGEGVNLLAEAGADVGWLEEFFADTGVEASVLKVGSIEGGTDIYQVIPAERLPKTTLEAEEDE